MSFPKIEDFLGKKCWLSIAGSGTGSIFTLGFGKKVPRDSPHTNSNLTIEEQNYDSEYSLMVWSSWSLFKEKVLVCDSNSPNERDGQMVVGLRKLVGKRINKITIHNTTFDLEIEFDNNYSMFIIADSYNLYGENADNYVLFFPEFTLSVTAGLKIKKRLR